MFKFFIWLKVFLVGHVTAYIYLKAIRQINFLKKPSLGKPDILKINFVLKLKNIKRINGKDEINWIIKYSGFLYEMSLLRGKNPKIKIIKKENLLFIFP